MSPRGFKDQGVCSKGKTLELVEVKRGQGLDTVHCCLTSSFRGGITCAAAATRRSPHCFNLMRQMEVLERAGVANEAESVL